MNPLRKLGWMLLLALTGLAAWGPAGDGAGKSRRPTAGPAAAPPAEGGAAQAAPAPGRDDASLSFPWWDEEDEFEGEGWTFWGR